MLTEFEFSQKMAEALNAQLKLPYFISTDEEKKTGGWIRVFHRFGRCKNVLILYNKIRLFLSSKNLCLLIF